MVYLKVKFLGNFRITSKNQGLEISQNIDIVQKKYESSQFKNINYRKLITHFVM
jgi:hypothetical protein